MPGSIEMNRTPFGLHPSMEKKNKRGWLKYNFLILPNKATIMPHQVTWLKVGDVQRLSVKIIQVRF
jgi:hypothetical protein